MLAASLVLSLLAVAPVDSAAGPDTLRNRPPRIVRQFPAIEVRAPIHDLRSSQTVHVVNSGALKTLPVEDLAAVVRLQPGVVAEGGELHVRGGRAGELEQMLDGVPLNDRLHHRIAEVPVFALRSAELVSGGQDAEHPGSLAGVLDLRTVDPGERWNAAWRYAGDGGLDTRFDDVDARFGGPLPLGGLGVAAALNGRFDDGWMPSLRSSFTHDALGVPLGWRAENRMAGWLKLARPSSTGGASLQVLATREVNRPYNPMWTEDGWYAPCGDDSCTKPGFSKVELPGYHRYRAADHAGIDDAHRYAMILNVSRAHDRSASGLALSWSRAERVSSRDGTPSEVYVHDAFDAPIFLPPETTPPRPGLEPFDSYHVYWGDAPLVHVEKSEAWTLRADHTRAWSRGSLKAGAGLSYEDLRLRELDGTQIGKGSGIDSLRAFHAHAPGAYAYAQTRWTREGMIVNAGLRTEYFTPGPQAPDQTLPAPAEGQWTFSPRLGVAYPISVRDVFSLAYVRLDQPPPRDVLYDHRRYPSARQPLGNAALDPSTAISYQAAVKHLFSAEWATQFSVFYRDVFGQIGARQRYVPGVGITRLQYTSDDESHALGFEWEVVHDGARGRRTSLQYTWMQAYGNESRPEGDPYLPAGTPQTVPLADRPLSWDRRHSLSFTGYWPLQTEWTLAWATLAGSGLPWTPKERRAPLADLSLVDSRRLGWFENTDASLRWAPPILPFPVAFGLEVLNVFDTRFDRAVTVDGYPNPVVNTAYDDYGAYRTATGLGGGAYWEDRDGDGRPGWIPIYDPRLANPPRRLRASISASW